MSDNIRLGLIGTGRHGSRYAEHIINDLDGFTLTAISRRSEYGIVQAEKWNCRYLSNWRELVALPDVEAVISVTPPYLNEAIAKSCCASAKHLLIEKPLAPDAVTAKQIVKLFHESGLKLTVGHTLRFNPIILELKNKLPELGKMYAINAQQRLEPSTLAWLEDKKHSGGGVILHTAIHIFDSLRFITGRKIIRVRATAGQIHNSQVEDLFSAQFEMENNVTGTVSASKVGQGRCGSYEFICNEGQLHGDQVHGNIQLINNREIQTQNIRRKPTIIPLLEKWHKFLAGKDKNPISGEEGLMAIKICQACYRSLKTENWVTI